MSDRRKGVRPKHDHYLAISRTVEDGVETKRSTEEVDRDYVIRYCDAKSFFTGLGGLEEYQCFQDRRLVTSTSPDRRMVRTTLFTPIQKASK